MKHRFIPTDNPMFPAGDPLVAGFDPFAFASPGTCFGPLAAAAGAGAAIAGGTGLISASTASIIGGVSGLAGIGAGLLGSQRTAGGYDTAAGIALAQAKANKLRADAIARMDYDAANEAEAIAQRKGLVDLEQGDIAAGRAQAVMAASGAGVDYKLLAAIKGKANYNAAVDRWSGADKARLLRNEGVLTSWAGEFGDVQGQAESEILHERAQYTRDMGWAQAGLSLASKYGVPGGSSTPISLTEKGAFDIGRDAVTRAGGPTIIPDNPVA